MKKKNPPRRTKNAIPIPAKTAATMPSPTELLPEIKNEGQRLVANGLSEAIMGFSPTESIGTQLNQVGTLFKNNRWYLISNMRQILSQIYVEHGLVQTIVDVPVDDAFRGGVTVKSKQLSPEQIEELQAKMDRAGDYTHAAQAVKWNRLYGGAGIMIITDQDPMEPLDLDALKEESDLEFRAVDMWELYWDMQNTSDYNPSIQEHDFEYYSYYGVKVHKSRVLIMKGMVAPSFIRPRLRGWGFSVVESLVNSINQYLKANNLSFEVLDEFKIDVYKIKNLTGTLMSSDGTNAVHRRVQLANWQKNYQNAITMDSEDDYIQKQLSFAGIAETMVQIRMQVASDMRMPLTKLFGVSSQGFNSGEDDIENYNAMIESQVRQKVKYDLLKMIELRCKQIFGYIPDDLSIEFEPLRVMSSEQQENVKNARFARLMQALDKGAMSVKEFKDACNKDDLLGVQLDTSIDSLTSEDDDGTQDDEALQEEPKKEAGVSGKSAPKPSKDSKETPEAKS